MLKIELRRAITPEETGEQPCALCGAPFEVRSVYAWATNGEQVVGEDGRSAACPECVAYFAKRTPSAFPSLESYRAAEESYSEPISSVEEMLRLEDADDRPAVARVYQQAHLS